MTTPYAAQLYLAQHQMELEGKPYAVFNPHNRPIDELPFIIGFNNGGSDSWYSAVSISEDGHCLGSHICSHEGYMRHDLGILEGTREDRHTDQYQKHYPDGYRMAFVPTGEVKSCEMLQKAFRLNDELESAAEAKAEAATTATAPEN